MTTHLIRAQPSIKFRVPGCEDLEGADPLIDIEFTFAAGYPASGPSYASGGDPGAGPELELVRAKLIDGDGLDPPQQVVDEWAQDWLNDDGYERACQLAEDEQGPDPDAAYDRMRDEGR